MDIPVLVLQVLGSRPRTDLMCPLVTGCTDLRPDYRRDETIITSLCNPVKRSVTAFFYVYAPPHTSLKKGRDSRTHGKKVCGENTKVLGTVLFVIC